MAISIRRSLAAGILACMVGNVSAQELVRDGGLIETVPIQGVTLAMTPEEAFEHLYSQGFRAGDIQEFSDWQQNGIEFVRGTYGSPDGHTSLVLSRNGERIIQISETYSQPGRPLDAESEIGNARRHFGVASDAPSCEAANPHNGICSVQDAEEAEDVDLVYGLQVMSIMRLHHAMRNKELGAALR